MKIISKFKDFYDYKVTKYGVDEKLVYTRKTYCEYFQGFFRDINIDYRISEDDFNKNLKENTKVTDEKNIHKILFIGEKLIHLFFTENGVYTHLDIKNNEDLRKYTDFEYRKEITFKDGKKFNIYTRFKDDWEYLLSYNRKKLINLNINKDNHTINVTAGKITGLDSIRDYLYNKLVPNESDRFYNKYPKDRIFTDLNSCKIKIKEIPGLERSSVNVAMNGDLNGVMCTYNPGNFTSTTRPDFMYDLANYNKNCTVVIEGDNTYREFKFNNLNNDITLLNANDKEFVKLCSLSGITGFNENQIDIDLTKSWYIAESIAKPDWIKMNIWIGDTSLPIMFSKLILPEEKPQDGTADANQSANANQSADANKQQTKNNAQQPADANQQAGANTTEPAKPDLSNIDLTVAKIKFKGTYTDLANLVKLVDENSKNIVSNELKITRKTVEDQKEFLFLKSKGKTNLSDEYIEGDLELRFFRISSIEKYVPNPDSKLKAPLVPKSTKRTPVTDYDWAAVSIITFNTSTGEVINTVTRNEFGVFDYSKSTGSNLGSGGTGSSGGVSSGTGGVVEPPKSNAVVQPIQPGPAPVFSKPKNVEPQVPAKEFVTYTTPIELVRFDSLSDFFGRGENAGDSVAIGMDEISSKKYKIIKNSISFAQNSPKGNKVIFDVTKKDIKLNEKPEKIQLNIYTANPVEYEVGLVFSDKEGKKYIPFNKKLSFTGWEKIELTPNTVLFPATLEGIYFSRANQDAPLNSEVYIDNLSAVYVQKK